MTDGDGRGEESDGAGDPSLSRRLRELLAPRHPVAAAATVVAGRTSIAALGADLRADFELGSVSKAVTGLPTPTPSTGTGSACWRSRDPEADGRGPTGRTTAETVPRLRVAF